HTPDLWGHRPGGAGERVPAPLPACRPPGDAPSPLHHKEDLMVKLRRGDRRWAVRWLERALNKRARKRGLPLVNVDGVLGIEDLMSVQRVGRWLGALESTLALAHPARGKDA